VACEFGSKFATGSKAKAKSIFKAAKFDLMSRRMSIRDGVIQAVLIGQKRL
jgi:hypothetical protein